jgi:hypothetical protein
MYHCVFLDCIIVAKIHRELKSPTCFFSLWDIISCFEKKKKVEQILKIIKKILVALTQ